jgi:CRP/FNR family transcriptional regulator, cyclic AMP receptor protein
MASEEHFAVDGQREAPTIRWHPPRVPVCRLEATALFAYILDEDPDLADEFDIRARVAARQLATARVLHTGIGECDLRPWLDVIGAGPGLLILEGVVASETRVGDRTALELIGAGDLLYLPGHNLDDLLERRDGWRVLRAARLALLDAEFADRVRPWPQILEALLRRAGRRIADVDALRAISCQPRLEVRLVLLLWHLATRWGRVEPAGIRVALPLTHRLLGQLAGAERPSISHALARLSQSGLVTGHADDLHLHGTLQQHIETLLERGAASRPPPMRRVEPMPNGSRRV